MLTVCLHVRGSIISAGALLPNAKVSLKTRNGTAGHARNVLLQGLYDTLATNWTKEGDDYPKKGLDPLDDA